jgi:ribose transport system substrate-binding protein
VFQLRLSAVLYCALMAGCAKEAGTSGPVKYRIAVIPKGTTHEFWKSVHAGAEQAAKEFGNVEVIWKGPLLESDREAQIKVVENFAIKGVSGICLAPLDSQALIGPVRTARRDGVPTVIFDSGLNDPDDPPCYVSYVATDNYRGGVLAAQHLGKILGGKGNVAMLRYNPGSESTEQREQGFLETLQKDFPGIEVVSSDQYAGTTPEEALRRSEQLLLTYKNLNGVFVVCEPNGAGMLKALENAKLAGKVKFIAFDPNPRLIEAMGEGKVDGIVLQDPVRMGYLAVKTMVEHLQGKPVKTRLPTGEFLATPENMKTPEMAKLLAPVQF